MIDKFQFVDLWEMRLKMVQNGHHRSLQVFKVLIWKENWSSTTHDSDFHPMTRGLDFSLKIDRRKSSPLLGGSLLWHVSIFESARNKIPLGRGVFFKKHFGRGVFSRFKIVRFSRNQDPLKKGVFSWFKKNLCFKGRFKSTWIGPNCTGVVSRGLVWFRTFEICQGVFLPRTHVINKHDQ